MLIFAVTTSTDINSFSLYKDSKKVFSNSWTQKQKKSDALVEEFDSSLKESKFNYSDLTTLLLDIGPGSFTGCRIAANFIKTIAQQFHLQVHTISSLDIILNQSKNPQTTLALLDANKSLYYSKFFSDDKIFLIEHKNIHQYHNKFQLSIDEAPRSETMVQLFQEKPSYYKVMHWSKVEPLYIRSPEIVEKNLK